MNDLTTRVNVHGSIGFRFYGDDNESCPWTDRYMVRAGYYDLRDVIKKVIARQWDRFLLGDVCLEVDKKLYAKVKSRLIERSKGDAIGYDVYLFDTETKDYRIADRVIEDVERSNLVSLSPVTGCWLDADCPIFS